MRNCLDSGLSRKTLLVDSFMEIVYEVLFYEAKYFQSSKKKNGCSNSAVLNHKYMIKQPLLSVWLQKYLESITFLFLESVRCVF